MRLNNLIYKGKHGLEAWEKVTAQRFEVNLEIRLNSEKSFETDDVNDSVNWVELRDTVKSIIENESFNLVEALTARIADTLLEFQQIQGVTVSVGKLDIWDGNGYPSITVIKTRQ